MSFSISNFSPINIPYGTCLLKSDVDHRQGAPGPAVFGDGIHYTECIPKVVKTPQEIGPQNTKSVNILDSYFTSGKTPCGVTPGCIVQADGFSKQTFSNIYSNYANTDLQVPRPPQPQVNYYVQLAGETLHAKPDQTISIFFSDENIKHLINTVVRKVKEITSDTGVAGSNEGVTIKTPHMDDFFYYMINIYQQYKINNGSICFVGLKNNTNLQQEITKLNSNILQDYVSKMVSQINMYIYYYKDASQLPEPLSLPTYTSMRSNNKVLEYNTGFTSGNSIGMASYDQVGNIFGTNGF